MVQMMKLNREAFIEFRFALFVAEFYSPNPTERPNSIAWKQDHGIILASHFKDRSLVFEGLNNLRINIASVVTRSK